MTDQRCGTCRWWKKQTLTTDDGRLYIPSDGDCGCPLPQALPFSVKRRTTTPDQGANCPCYQRKERDEREGTD